MSWVPLNGYAENMDRRDEPRKLTDQEIQYIVDHVPLAPSADSTAAEVSRKGVADWIASKLRDVKLCPSAIPDVIQKIVKEHQKSLVPPGTTVGILAGEAVGATTTQMVLNTFHKSGSSKSASYGIEVMRDLMFARKKPKNESSTIYYINKLMSFEEVLDSRRYIVGSMAADFVKSYDIDAPANLPRYWWHDFTRTLFDKDIPDSTQVMRLFLNLPEMFRHRVSIADLAAALERETPSSLVAVHGPISDGIIDLYPKRGIVVEILKEKLKDKAKGAVPLGIAEVTYLETIVQPELAKIRVKGIAGIRRLEPLISPTWRMVILERKIEAADLVNEAVREILGAYVGSAWSLFYNDDIMAMTGLVAENLAALCELAGLKVLESLEDRLNVNMPDDRFRTAGGSVVLENANQKFRQITAPVVYVDQNAAISPVRLHDTDAVYLELMPGTFKDENGVLTEEIEENIQQILDAAAVLMHDTKVYRRIDDYLERDGTIFERITDPRIKLNELKPSEYITHQVNQDRIRRDTEIKQRTNERLARAKDIPEAQRREFLRAPVIVPRTPLMLAAEFVIAETDGTNLKELLALPGIDKTHTTCNNMYTIASALGIEAARSFLIRTLGATIANTGSYVNPANITFIAEFITSRGEPYGATYTGISRQPGGHLSLATVERAGKVFMQNALHGQGEDTRNVSASVAVGARMAIGNGSFDIAQTITQDGVQRIVINDELFTALDRDDSARELHDQRKRDEAETQGNTVQAQELMDELDGLVVGGAYDFTGEEEANLNAVYGHGEIVQDITRVRRTQVTEPKKVLKRVPQTTEIPQGLVDVLQLINVGVPTDEPAQTLKIKPLEARPIVEPLTPVISTGLIPIQELVPEEEEEFPAELAALLAGPMGITAEMPRVEIPKLPDLTGFDVMAAAVERRTAQIRELKPIDITALRQDL